MDTRAQMRPSRVCDKMLQGQSDLRNGQMLTILKRSHELSKCYLIRTRSQSTISSAAILSLASLEHLPLEPHLSLDLRRNALQEVEEDPCSTKR